MNSCFGREQLHMLQWARRQSIASSREGIFTPSYRLTFALGENSCKCFTWARTAANASAAKAREEAEPCCYLQKGYLHQATELTFALGKSSCKCFTWARTAANASVDRRQSRIFAPSYELTLKVVALGENSCKCFTWASTMRGRQPAVSGSTIQC